MTYNYALRLLKEINDNLTLAPLSELRGSKRNHESVTNKQTDRQTKTQRLWLTRRRVKSEPNQTWHSDRPRGPGARSCTSKNSFAATGR